MLKSTPSCTPILGRKLSKITAAISPDGITNSWLRSSVPTFRLGLMTSRNYMACILRIETMTPCAQCVAGVSKRTRYRPTIRCIGVDRFKTRARERFVQPGDEYVRFAAALIQEPKETIRDFFWMCLFTGARRSNLLSMEWSQVDFDLRVWRIPVTKNGDSQTVPLTPNAIEILRRRQADEEAHECWVFPSDRTGRKTGVKGHLTSPKKAWARLLDRAKIDDLRIHDLRRTAGSYMAIQGVSPTIIGKALGHRSTQATAIYARLTQDPVRQALENAQAAFSKPEKLLPKNGNVVKLKKAE